MKEQLISFETAKLAKEKGFNEPIYKVYNADYVKKYSEEGGITDWDKSEGVVLGGLDHLGNCPDDKNLFPAPTQSLLQKWLREKHKIHIYVPIHGNSIKQKYVPYTLTKLNPNNTLEYNEYDTYEEALEAGLFEALKLII